MKIIVVISAVLAVVNSQQCDNSFKGYLDCIADSTGDASRGRSLEQEFGDDFATLAMRSFDQSRSPSNQKCVLSRQELSIDIFGDEGPLHGCRECQKIAQEMKSKFFSASDEVGRCLRTEFAYAVIDELQPCIGGKMGDPNFRVPNPPDFDAHTSGFKDLILKNIETRVMVYSRLSTCQGAFPQRAQVTKNLLADKTGLFKQHCALDQSCSSKVASNCQQRFIQAKIATCSCMPEKRSDWHVKFDSVKKAIENFDSASQCSAAIKEAVGGWRYKLQNTMKKCIPDKDNILASVGIDKAIDQACSDVERLNPDQRQQVVTGIRMIRHLLDAINDRITRFCDIKC